MLLSEILVTDLITRAKVIHKITYLVNPKKSIICEIFKYHKHIYIRKLANVALIVHGYLFYASDFRMRMSYIY